MTSEKKNFVYKEFKSFIKEEGIVIMSSSKRPLSTNDYKACYKWLHNKIGQEAYGFLPELINALVKSQKKNVKKEENVIKSSKEKDTKETPIIESIYNPKPVAKSSKVTFEDLEEHFGNAQKRRKAFEKMSETMKIDVLLSLSK